MSNINPSHYFERIEHYLHTANGAKPLQAMEEMVTAVGTPTDMVDSVVNGAVMDFIYDMMPPQNDLVQIYDNNGNAVYVQKIKMNLEQWVEALRYTFIGMEANRISSIMEFMLQNGFIVMEPFTSVLYRGTAPGRRSLIDFTKSEMP